LYVQLSLKEAAPQRFVWNVHDRLEKQLFLLLLPNIERRGFLDRTQPLRRS
jgi:hypothetical protein